MSRAERLQPAREVAERRERDAAVELAAARRALDAAQARLQELQRFRIEYAQRLASSPGGSLGSASLLKDGHAFLARVDAGIEQAERNLLEHRRLCESRHAHWLACRVRARAIDKVAERHRAREAVQADRLEQREQDEFASRPRR